MDRLRSLIMAAALLAAQLRDWQLIQQVILCVHEKPAQMRQGSAGILLVRAVNDRCCNQSVFPCVR